MTVAARVVALYRYPVKSFTPEARTSLAIGDDGRVVGDRVFGFRFADTAAPADEWSDKHAMLALVNTPGIARLFVTAHSRASLAALRDHLADPALDETRFRTNIVIDGVEPFAELGWLGRRVRIGDVTATVEYSCERCLATHVDPALGVRDRSVMKALVQGFGQEHPTFAVALRFDTPGRIGLSDPVELLR